MLMLKVLIWRLWLSVKSGAGLLESLNLDSFINKLIKSAVEKYFVFHRTFF